MTARINNELGTIFIEYEVIALIAGNAAMDCFGIVGMAAKNVKAGIVQLLKRESLTKGIRLQVVDNTLHINFHVIVEYGTNIMAVSETLVSNVKYNVEEYIGIPVGKVNILVDGMRVDN